MRTNDNSDNQDNHKNTVGIGPQHASQIFIPLAGSILVTTIMIMIIMIYFCSLPFTRTISESAAYKARGLLLLRALLCRLISSWTVGGPRDLDLRAGDAAILPATPRADPVPR